MLDLNTDSKKIFFLYPSRHFEATVIYELIKEEYEVFVLQDYKELPKVFHLEENPVFFINVGIQPRGLVWNEFCESLYAIREKGSFNLWLISSSSNPDVVVPKDIPKISLDNGIPACTAYIKEELKKIDAKGRRKYVRAHINDPHRASFSLRKSDKTHVGSILDISTNGMACSFQSELQLMADSYIKDLQLRLDGVVMNVAGKVAYVREGEKKVYVVLFDYKVTYKYREKIQYFVYHTQQRYLHDLLKTVK